MKYAKFSDDFLPYFRLDDSGETLVLTDKRGYTRAVELLPYEERPQGHWVRDINPYDKAYQLKCSVCGKWGGLTDKGYNHEFNFCPNCGAKMKGDNK